MYNKIGVIMFQKDPEHTDNFVMLSDSSRKLSADSGCLR